MNDQAFYFGILHELSLIKKADAQVVYPQQKKPNTFRNLALAGLGAAGLGLGGYSAYKHFGAGNSLPPSNATPGPAQPASVPPSLSPVENSSSSTTPSITQSGVSNQIQSWLKGETIPTSKPKLPPIDPALAEELDLRVKTDSLIPWVQGNNSQPAPTATQQLVGHAGQNLNRLGLAASFGGSKLPIVGKAIGALDKTVARIPMGPMAKALPVKAFPLLSSPLSMYHHLHDDTVPNYYLGPDASQSAKTKVQTAAGLGESLSNVHRVGMLGNIARSLGVDIPLANAESFQQGFNSKSEGYRKMMDYLMKTTQSQDPAIRERATQAAQHLTSGSHSNELEKLTNPGFFDKLRLNNYNYEPQNMIPFYGGYKHLMKTTSLLKGDEGSEGQVTGAPELLKLRQLLQERVNNYNPGLANNQQ